MIQLVGGQQSICALLESLSNHANVTHQGQKDMIHYILKVHIVLSFSLSILTAIFPGAPGLACTRISLFWILLELKMMEVVVTMGAIRRAKLQSNCHQLQTNTLFFYRPDVFPVTQPTVLEHWWKDGKTYRMIVLCNWRYLFVNICDICPWIHLITYRERQYVDDVCGRCGVLALER